MIGTKTFFSGRGRSHVHISLRFLCVINSFADLVYALISADLAKYEIGRVLGAGSFGQVVAATRKSDNKPVCSSSVTIEFVDRSNVIKPQILKVR